MLTNIQVYLEDNEFNSLINNFYTSSEVWIYTIINCHFSLFWHV